MPLLLALFQSPLVLPAENCVLQDVVENPPDGALLVPHPRQSALHHRRRSCCRAAAHHPDCHYSLLNRASDVPLPEPVEPHVAPLGFTVDELLLKARDAAPMLAREQKMIERAGSALNLARKDYYPDFTINGGFHDVRARSGGPYVRERLVLVLPLTLFLILKLELQPSRLRIATYEDRRGRAGRGREYVFDHLPDGISDRLYPPLAASLDRRFVAHVAAAGEKPLFEIPAKLLHRGRDANGVLKVGAESIVFTAAGGESARVAL